MEPFVFQKTRRGAVLTKCTRDTAYLTVPSEWNGLPVCEIGSYAFSDLSALRRVALPESVDAIGNHTFYNCAALEQLILQRGLHSVGDGAFKNCRSLHQISVRGLTYLKSIVTDFCNEVTLTIQTEDNQTAILLFPEYDYEFQEIIPPREFRSVTYGSGSYYRMCVARNGVDFAEYDRTFPRAVREDEPHTVRAIAFSRLLYPYQLRSAARDSYLSYLSDHIEEIVDEVVRLRSIPRLQLLLDHRLLPRDTVESAVAAASEHDFAEGVSLLMDYRLTHFGRAQRRFVL